MQTWLLLFLAAHIIVSSSLESSDDSIPCITSPRSGHRQFEFKVSDQTPELPTLEKSNDVWAIDPDDLDEIKNDFLASNKNSRIYLKHRFNIDFYSIAVRNLNKLTIPGMRCTDKQSKEECLFLGALTSYIAINRHKYLLDGGTLPELFPLSQCSDIGVFNNSPKSLPPIGSGMSSTMVPFNFNNVQLVTKYFKDRISSDQYEAELFGLSKFDHPNVIKPICFDFSDKNSPFIIFPRYTPIKKYKVPSFKAFCRGLMKGIYAIHQQNMLHLDIKRVNVVYRKEDLQFIVIDLGASMTFEDASASKSRLMTTFSSLAPEQWWSPLKLDEVYFDSFGYLEKCPNRPLDVRSSFELGRGTDWWQVGIAILNEAVLANGHSFVPQPNCSNPLMGSINIGFFLAGFDDEAKQFFKLFFTHDPADRDWSSSEERFQEIINHPFLLEEEK